MLADLEAGLLRAQAAAAVGVTPHTVSMWALRGWTEPDGTRRTLRVVGYRRGARLYRYGDVLHAERVTRQSPQSRRAA